ncbi:MAG TPA: energy transducer TonB [Gallionella sp.]|jgi:protein TonB|nr:energy transducer TonB [Gallionella sp.]
MLAIQNSVDLPLRDRILIVTLVVLAHVSLLWLMAVVPDLPSSKHHEMSVSVVLPSPPQAAPVAPVPEPVPEPKPLVKPKPKPKPEPKPQPVAEPIPVDTPQAETAPETVTPVATAETSVPAEASSAPSEPVNSSPGLPDREPDYQAAYLRNPVPAYPMVARRMGWQGRVVLNVEVLASGMPGRIELYQSSGHDVLDKAAMRAVSGWRFIAARQRGQEVTKWFLVPIPFILKEE